MFNHNITKMRYTMKINNNIIFENIKYFNNIIKKNTPFLFLFNFLNIVITSISPFYNIIISKKIIDLLIKMENINSLIMYILILIFGNACLGILELFTKYKFNLCLNKLEHIIVNNLNYKLLNIKYSDLDNPKIIRLLNEAKLVMSEYTEGIIENIQLANDLFKSLLTFVGVISIVFSYNSILLIIIAILSILFNIFMKKILDKFEIEYDNKIEKTTQEYEYYNYSLKSLNFGKDIRLYSMQALITKKSQDINDYRNSIRKTKYNKLSLISIPQNIFKYLIENFFTFMILIYFAKTGEISISDFTMLLSTISLFSYSVTTFFNSVKEYYVVSNYQSPYIKFMNLSTENISELIFTDSKVNIEFKNVSFKYPNSNKYILKNFNLSMKSGEKIALVGLNGSGKSTIIKLLCKLYYINEGEILINNININNYNFDEYSKLLSVVFQDFKILSFTIKNNISIEDDNILKLYDVLNKVSMAKKIKSLPLRENTYVNKWFDNNGIELSGGEMQKIAIARSIYKESPIIILDEPTASLDPIMEADIYKNFNHLIGNDKLAIYISHRLSSCKFCDRIVVISNGQVVENGKHKDLLEQKGLYYEMFNTQAQYYKD